MSGSNIKGAFERALTRWHFAANYVCRRMGRGSMSAVQAALGLREHASRALYHRDGNLIAFPGLETIALWLGVSEKTARRGINRLEEAGLVRTQHRFNASNLYYLIIPPEAESHLQHCEIVIEKRRRARQQRRSQLSTPNMNNVAGMAGQTIEISKGGRSHLSGLGGQLGVAAVTKCPTTSDCTSEFTSISKSSDLASLVSSEDQRKRVGGEERIAASPCSPASSNPEESVAFEVARKHYGERGASLVALRLGNGVPAAEILYELTECIEHDNDPGYALWFPDYR